MLCRLFINELVVYYMDMIRRHYNFFGWVQGVGFRYTAQYAANAHGVTGWVRNEYDGSVTMEIQGSEEQLDKVVQAINNARYISIEKTMLIIYLYYF